MSIKNKLVNTTKDCYTALRFAARFPSQVMKINQLIDKPSYYPEMPRKSRQEMWKDNFKWLCKDWELNTFYTSYGLDIKGFRNPDDYIPHRHFCKMRNAGNQKNLKTPTGKYNYLALLRDKYAFSAYLSSTIGEQYVVKSIGIVDRNGIFFCDRKEWADIEELLTLEGRWVFKIIDGECGDGVFLVTIAGGKIKTGSDEYTPKEFAAKFVNKNRWLIQPVIEQHEALKAFKTRSVNTIRAVTIRGKSGSIGVFNAFLRLGADDKSFVDNRALGGYGVGIDLEKGTLMKYGYQHDSFGGKASQHPLSGIVFEGYEIPCWKETIDLIRNAHRQFYELQSIGWDIVITKDGPVLLEGNDDWEVGGPQDTYGGLKKKWNELVNA